MPRWFGRRGREEKGAAATDALLGAAQERGIPTMRVDEVAISLGVAAYLAEAEGLLRAVESGSPQWAPRAAFGLGGVLVIQRRRS